MIWAIFDHFYPRIRYLNGRRLSLRLAFLAVDSALLSQWGRLCKCLLIRKCLCIPPPLAAPSPYSFYLPLPSFEQATRATKCIQARVIVWPIVQARRERWGKVGRVLLCGAGPTPAGCERRTDGSRARGRSPGFFSFIYRRRGRRVEKSGSFESVMLLLSGWARCCSYRARLLLRR